MTRLSPSDYRRHLDAESARFRAVLADCDPEARVPSCPDWDAADLLWHVGEVQHFWATIVRQRPTGPEDLVEPTRPDSQEGLLTFFDTSSARLLAELGSVPPTDEVWTWSQEHTAGFVLRRQAHEALVHRLDAELTAGIGTPLDPALAADGVDEALDVMFGGCPPWGEFTGTDRFVRVDLTDTGHRVWVQLGRFRGTDPDDGTVHDSDDLHVVPDPGVEPAVVLSGPAAALDAWLWRRGDDRDIAVTGDPVVHATFLGCVDHPIN